MLQVVDERLNAEQKAVVDIVMDLLHGVKVEAVAGLSESMGLRNTFELLVEESYK